MKILGICCSPRKGKTTLAAMKACLAAAAEVDPAVETECIELAGRDMRGCTACGRCGEGLTCSIADDFPALIPTLADEAVGGIVIGTPVYFGTMTSQCKALLDRCVMMRRNGWRWSGKVGGVLAVGGVRNGGQELTLQAVHAAMGCQDMIIVSDGRPTAHFGGALVSGAKAGIVGDELGIDTAQNLGRNVARVALKLHGT